MGFQDRRLGGRAAAAVMAGISRAAAGRSDFGFSLRDAMEPARQSMEGRAVHGSVEASETEDGRGVCVGAGRRGLYGKRAVERFGAARRAVRVCARRRTAARGTWRAVAFGCTTTVCMEKCEVGAWIHVAGPR